jgi:multidrug efflux pump subunit AcrA (membrane-fusion protein)
MATARSTRPWPTYALGALCAGAVVAAVLVVGPASGSTSSTGRTIAVAQGVVQSTVSGSGNVQAASQLDLGFKTGGVVTRIYAAQGAHVTEGQLLAELNPTSAEVTLEQAKASLQAAEASLAQEEETDGETASGASSSGSDASRATASAAAVAPAPAAGTANPSTTTPATTTPAQTAPSSKTTSSKRTGTATGTQRSNRAGGTQTRTSSQGSGSRSGSSTAVAGNTNSSSSTPKATVSTATREANLASARAAVKSDKLTVQSAEEALADTKLFAPENGTLVTLFGEVGETVTGSGTTRSSASSSSSSGSESAAASTLGGAAASGSGASASDSSSGSSSSSFAVLSDLSSMQLVVALSESEVGSVRVGQPATVTIEALESTKLAAHVLSVATLPTSTSGVVSYDVTFQLDQLASGLKPGMSATAEVVVKQAEGVNVPTTAIAADTVTVVRGDKDVRQRVVTGLAGNSSTIILSGLKAGEEIVLPVAHTSSTASSLTSRFGARTGAALGGAAAGLGGGPAGGFGGGGGFRGG